MPITRAVLAPLCATFILAASPAAKAHDMRVVRDCDTVRTLNQSARASWYGPRFHGRQTANGEIYNQNAMTAAHKTLKLGTRVLVENIKNGEQVVLRVNDRGPYIDGRTLDVSKKAADVLGFRDDGIAKIKLSVCAG